MKTLPKGIEVQPTCLGLTWSDQQDPFSINVWFNPILFQKVKSKKRAAELERQLDSIVVHEVSHVVQFVCKAVEIDKLDDETSAYLSQWLFAEVKKTLSE